MKKFFSITEEKYVFEFWDLTTIITLLNVILVLCGFWWAPFVGLINCIVFTILNIKNKAHLNNYLTQMALIILNIYFLTL